MTVCAGAAGVACDAQPGDPIAEVCDGVDNNCDGQTDNIDVAVGIGGADDCAACADRCPVDDVPDGAQLCVALPGGGNCPDEWPDRIAPLSNGEVAGQLFCSPCDCGAQVVTSAGADGQCGNPQDVSRFTCGSQNGGDADEGGQCDTGCEYRGTALSHSAEMEIIRWGGGDRLDGCEIDGGRTVRLCCRDDLPADEACGGPLCPAPGNSLGFVIQGEAFAVAAACGAAGGSAGTLKGGAEAVGQCLNCHCRAELVGRLCNYETTDSCVAAAHGATCELDCLAEARQLGDQAQAFVTLPRYVVNLEQDGLSPDTTEGAGCQATGVVHVCDLDAGLID